MPKLFSKIARRARSLKHFAKMERQAGSGKVRLGKLAQGFLSQRGDLYPFDRYDRRWFLTDWEIESRLRDINDENAVGLLDDKLIFHYLLASQCPAIRMPALAGLSIAGRFVPIGQDHEIDTAFREHGSLISKPVSGWGGAGVRTLRPGDALPSEGAHLIEAQIDQHNYAATIFPGSINTIRVVTMVDAQGPFLVGAAHRFGALQTIPVDNFKRGGLSALVDPKSGRLSRARSNPGFHAQNTHRTHPDTGAEIEGVTVPMWSEVLALAMRLAALVPGMRHAGWDLCVTPTGPCVIEGNGRLPNPNLLQTHRPILLDGRVRAFLCAHNVLSDRRARQLHGLAEDPAHGAS